MAFGHILSDLEDGEKWYNKYIELIDDKVKLVGNYVNVYLNKNQSPVRNNMAIYLDINKSFFIHMKTHIWCTDLVGLKLLLPYFRISYKKKEFYINKIIIRRGYDMIAFDNRMNKLNLRKRRTKMEAQKIYKQYLNVPLKEFIWYHSRNEYFKKNLHHIYDIHDENGL